MQDNSRCSILRVKDTEGVTRQTGTGNAAYEKGARRSRLVDIREIIFTLHD